MLRTLRVNAHAKGVETLEQVQTYLKTIEIPLFQPPSSQKHTQIPIAYDRSSAVVRENVKVP